MIHKAERYDIKGKDTVSGNCKYYINDLAFKNYLYSDFAYGIGYKLENLVYLQLRRSGYNVYVRREYASLEAIQDNYEKYVVSLEDFSFPFNKGIQHIQAWKLAEII